MAERFLELTRLGKTYQTPNGPAVIVKDFDLLVSEGEFVCVIGHSGCGKSTVLSIVMGLNDPTAGGVILAGHEVVGPGTDRGVVFQSPALLPWLAARGNVLLAVEQVNGRHGRAGRRKLADRIVMMTSGPAATVGEILTIPFPRPRCRVDVLNHPEYCQLRDHLIAFLEERAVVRS
jgi:ABC-type nitrate/sulfonate/bicarbonate transport system ATPase subunit